MICIRSQAMRQDVGHWLRDVAYEVAVKANSNGVTLLGQVGTETTVFRYLNLR